jgi:hypothetical protein
MKSMPSEVRERERDGEGGGVAWTELTPCVCAGARFDDGAGGDNEVQRTMLEIVNQLDGFDARGNIKVLMATNRSGGLGRGWEKRRKKEGKKREYSIWSPFGMCGYAAADWGDQAGAERIRGTARRTVEESERV